MILYLYCVADVDMGDGGSVDSGRPETPDTDESSEVGIVCLVCLNVCFETGWAYSYSD